MDKASGLEISRFWGHFSLLHNWGFQGAEYLKNPPTCSVGALTGFAISTLSTYISSCSQNTTSKSKFEKLLDVLRYSGRESTWNSNLDQFSCCLVKN